MNKSVYIPQLELNNGVMTDQLGYGTYKIEDQTAVNKVHEALEVGYRSFDTAAAYNNENGVGQAIAQALDASDLTRDDLFITTKLHNRHQGYASTLKECDTSLEKLGLDYLDMYLIHWPLPEIDLYVETWKAFEKLYADGKVRAIGVCNFTEKTLTRLLNETTVVPAVNQIELHPYFQQEQMRALDSSHGIITQAWAPVGRGQIFDDPTLQSIAQTTGKTVPQIVLRWQIQLGNIAIPKASSVEHMKENIDIFDFELTDTQMQEIAGLDRGDRMGPEPDSYNQQ